MQTSTGVVHYLSTREWRVRRVNASNVAVFLESQANGINNWTLETGTGSQVAAPEPAPTREQAEAAARDALASLSQLVIDEIRLTRLHVEYVGPDKKLRLYSIPDLHASAPAGKPVTMKFRGVVDSLFPFDVELTGGALREFADPNKPWPFTVVTSALGSTMTLDGSFKPDETSVQFGWGTPDPAVASRILQVQLPDVGPTAVAAQISVSPGRVRMQNLRGWMGVTQLTGDVTVRTDTARPLIQGELAVPVLDLKPFLSEGPGASASGAPGAQAVATDTASEDTAGTLAEWYRSRADGVLDLGALDQFDADLQLSVGRWLSLPGNVRDAGLHVRLNNGRLSAPVSAQLAGVSMTGDINIDGGQREPRIELALNALDTELGEFARFMFGLPGVRGHLDSLSLRLAGQGRSIADQVNSMALDLNMAGGQLTYGNQAGQKPVAFGLNDLSMTVAPGEALKVAGNGSLLDQPLDISFTGTPLKQLLTEGQSRIDIKARSRSMTARVRGSVGQKSTDGNISTGLFVGVSARRARDVAAWFGIGRKVDAPFSMAGNFTWDGKNWAVRDGRLGVGRNGIRAEISQKARGLHPLMQATITADTLDVAQLQSLFESNEKEQTPKEDGDGSVVNIPVLPQGIDLTDTDLKIRVGHLKRPRFDVRDLKFDATIRNGRMVASPLAGTVFEVPLSGAVELDLRSNKPRGQWWLATADVDIGKLLRRLKIVDNLDANADLFSMHLDIRGNRLGEVLESSSLTIEISGGDFAIRDRNTGAAARFGIDQATVQAPAGKPLQAKISGQWNQEPVQITLGAAKALELLDSTKPVPVSATLSVADTELELFGKLGRNFGAGKAQGSGTDRAVPTTDRELKLNMLLNGKRFDTLNRLSGVSLPPWGPYEMNGVVKISADGYEVPNLSLIVGSSQLDGTGTVLTTESPPRVSVLLNSNQLQLNDFRFGDWDPAGTETKEDDEKAGSEGLDTEAVRRQARQASEQTQALLSPETLAQFNGGVRVTVNDVRSGNDKLGSGSMRLNVFDSIATIGPVRVQLPDSSASLKLNYAPDADGIEMRTQIQADQFDYGFLARRIDPQTTLEGRVSMDVDINASTPSLARAMEFSSGKIDIDVWPQNVQADVFDLWATNLFLTLATRLDPSSASKINCGVIRFRMQDGVLTHDQILLDTTRVRVAGEGSVDFKTEALRLKMEPLPKKAEFFSLATPIVVDGTFEDFSIGASAGDVAGTAIRLATSLLWVPLKKLFGRAVPDDGSDICGDPGRFVSSVAAVTDAGKSPADSPANSPNNAPNNALATTVTSGDVAETVANQAVVDNPGATASEADAPSAVSSSQQAAPVLQQPGKPVGAPPGQDATVAPRVPPGAADGFPVVRLEPAEPTNSSESTDVPAASTSTAGPESSLPNDAGSTGRAGPQWQDGDDDDPYIF